MHTDNSDVTFNICLGREFTGATLSFCGDMGAPRHRLLSYQYQHRRGRAVMHLGRRRHGADDIETGERLNLIVWCTNLAYRRSRSYQDLHTQAVYAAEEAPPDPKCLSYTHDRDFMFYREPTAQHAKMRRTAWVPPHFAKYPGYDEAGRKAAVANGVPATIELGGGETKDVLGLIGEDDGGYGAAELLELQAAIRDVASMAVLRSGKVGPQGEHV